MATNPLSNGDELETSNQVEDHRKSNHNIRCSTSNNQKILNSLGYIQKQSDIITLFLLLLCCWAIGYSLFGEAVGLQSPMFALVVLFLTAKIAGYLTSLLKLPPMVGMLLMGVLLRNVGFLQIEGDYRKFTAVLRQLALVNIMLPAGIGLDANALKKMIWMILNLAVIPVAVEVMGIAVASHYLLGLPWLWGILLGLLLAAVSPAVIIPCLFQLQDMGYGVNKGVHTLVIAASTINDIICIALFGIVIGLIFSTGSLTMQILQGPIVLIMGFAYGIAWGIICQFLPNISERYLITLRTLLLGLGCVAAALGSDALGYGGAGPLGCIVAAFVASLGWQKQGWGTSVLTMKLSLHLSILHPRVLINALEPRADEFRPALEILRANIFRIDWNGSKPCYTQWKYGGLVNYCNDVPTSASYYCILRLDLLERFQLKGEYIHSDLLDTQSDCASSIRPVSSGQGVWIR